MLLGKTYPHIDFKFGYQQAKPLKISFSSRIVPQFMFALQLFMILRVVVATCKATCYVKISRYFNARRREHLGVNKQERSIKSISSSILDHITNTGHSATNDDLCVIYNFINELDLLIHESLTSKIPR